MLNYNSDTKLFYLESDDINLLKVAYATRVLTPKGNYVWTFPGTFPDGLVALKDLHRIMPKLSLSTDAHSRLKYLQSIPNKIVDLTATSSIDIKLPIEPFIHQWKAIESTLHYPRLAIVYQQGLGKTFVAIASLMYKKELLGSKFGKTLIVMPKILLNNWAVEIDKYSEGRLRYRILTAVKNKTNYTKTLHSIMQEFADNKLDILITNFDTFVDRGDSDRAMNNINKIISIGFNRIIIDEASRLNSAKSKRATNIMRIAEKANEIYLLSGTISLGSPLDVYTPYTIMHPGIFGTNYYKFRNTHCIFSPYNKHIVIGYKDVATIKKKISNYTIFETRDNCLSLPDRLILEKNYPLSEEQVRWYDAIVSLDEIPLDHIDPNLSPLNVKPVVVKIIKLRQVLSGFINLAATEEDKPIIHKFPNGKLELLKTLLTSTDEKVIIWYSLKQELVDIETLLKELNITYIKAGDKDSYLKYEASADIQVFLGQISQGIGITLNSAKLMYYYSNSLKLEDREQSIDRNYRIGQNNKVVVYDLIHKGSLDSSILSLLKKKISVKDFMQESASCLLCDKLDYCHERAIQIYSSKCKYDAQVKSVEKINRIHLKELDF